MDERNRAFAEAAESLTKGSYRKWQERYERRAEVGRFSPLAASRAIGQKPVAFSRSGKLG